jgi:hypothetical protein
MAAPFKRLFFIKTPLQLMLLRLYSFKYMKSALTLVFLFVVNLALGQKGQSVSLAWKISPTEKLSYLTTMAEIDTAGAHIDFGGLTKLFSDSSKEKDNLANDMFKKLNQTMNNINFVSNLTNKGKNIIDITIVSTPKKNIQPPNYSPAKNEAVDMNSLLTGVAIRGSVFATGGVHSFWVKSSQKNLIAVFFELPKHPVKVGDTWPLDINLVSNDQNFVCDSSYKVNEAKLVDVRTDKGEAIATIKYTIAEYVKGAFTFGSTSQATIMKITYNGLAEFSISKGRWNSYNGIMSLDATGIMSAKKKTQFALSKQ